VPSYDALLDEALLASARGTHAERAAIIALLEAFPDARSGSALLVLNELWRGNLEDALRLAEALGDSPQERAVRAEVETYAGDPQGISRIESAVGEAPDDPIVLRCAFSVFGIEQPERAASIARRRIALRPHDPNCYHSLGTSLLTSSLAEAEQLAANPPAGFAESAQLWTLRARLAMRRHDLPAAEAHARTAVATCSDSYMAWSTLADILKLQGSKEEAERAARFSLELNRRNVLAMRVLASIEGGRGNRAEAKRWEEAAKHAIPALSFMNSLREANKLIRKGDPTAALAELAKLDGVPGATRKATLTIRTTLLLNMSDDAALLAEVDAMEREGFEGEVLVPARAEVCRRAGRMEEARALLESAWKERKGAALGPLVAMLAQMEDLGAAQQVAREAIQEVPGLPANASNGILALEKAGLRDEARALLDAAQRKFPESQMLRVLRVGTHAQDGNIPAMMHAMKGLDADHRLRLPIKFSPMRLLKALWHRRRRR
jgi:tetratricopeptide (TPR) repeat protein